MLETVRGGELDMHHTECKAPIEVRMTGKLAS